MPAAPNTRPRASPSRPAQNALATADAAWRTSCEAWKASGRSSTERRAIHSSTAPSVVGRLSRVGRPDCLHERADELLRRPFHPTNDRKVREIRTRASGGRERRRLPLATANSRSSKWESLNCSSPTGSRCDTTNKRWLSRACCTISSSAGGSRRSTTGAPRRSRSASRSPTRRWNALRTANEMRFALPSSASPSSLQPSRIRTSSSLAAPLLSNDRTTVSARS